ncbi:MAG: bifunctional oligoribonuclease/PAP phosphatase NrnA [Anaeromicrobium sp.]|jgi:phosphoesterase RecJ-like protein|nr:bifunctional oligoribonuclease/PAP phosphatase NrnA [Anaeromicrobium sp.]
MNNRLIEIIKVIKTSNKIIILPHIMPDGDTIGSSMALCLALKSLGKDVKIIMDEPLPNNIKFIEFEGINEWAYEFQYDLCITIDSSDTERLGKRSEYLKGNTINIDHHITNDFYGEYNLVDPKAAATGEIVYDLIKNLNVHMDKKIATCLYTALSTDTGSFKYDNTTSKTHKIVAELIDVGISVNSINVELYQNKPINKVKLLKDVINTMKFYYDGKVAIMHVTQKMLENNKMGISDTDGLIEMGRDIWGVEVSVLLKELEEKKVKVGLRSKYDVDVSKIAHIFGGGGHKKAAGCLINDSIKKVNEIIIENIEEYL